MLPPTRVPGSTISGQLHALYHSYDGTKNRRPRFSVDIHEKKRFVMLKKIIGLFLIGSSFALAACNTVEGAGKDVESADEAVQDAAN